MGTMLSTLNLTFIFPDRVLLALGCKIVTLGPASSSGLCLEWSITGGDCGLGLGVWAEVREE